MQMHFTSYAALQAALALPPLEPGAFRFARPWAGSTFECAQCRKAVPFNIGPVSVSTGYAFDEAKRMFCYACCGEREAATMQETGKGVLYWSGDNLTNWPGTLTIPVKRHKASRHNIAGWRYDLWFTYAGAEWHGVQYGDNTQICRVRRLKAA